MSRMRWRKPSAAGISLFPFLAVLVCTMGALIVLLVIVVRQAAWHAQRARQSVAEHHAAQQEELQQQQEEEKWRTDVLLQQRQEQTQRLADRRLELGYLEDHLRSLRQSWDRVAAELRALEETAEKQPVDFQALEAEQNRLQQQIAAAERNLEVARRRATDEPPCYAIIPYTGPHGTRRPPIYLECTGDGVVLQPEGIRFTPADFEGPMGPGNPLDAALLAVRQYHALIHNSATGESGGESNEPYPLLIVRPDGAFAFARARGAIKSWEDEVGFELVSADMKLAYPPADAELARVVQEAIRDARRRQEIMAAAAPSRYRGEWSNALRATSRGGFAPVDSLGSSDWLSRQTGTNGSGAIARGTADGRREGGSTTVTGEPDGASGRGTSASGYRSQQGQARGTQTEIDSGGTSTGGPQSQQGQARGTRTENDSGGTSTGGSQSQQGQARGTQMENDSGGASDGGYPTPNAAPGGNGGTSAGPSFSGRGTGGGSSARGGSNWALPGATAGASSITRAIGVECHADRLVIGVRGDRATRVDSLPLRGPLVHQLDDLLAMINHRIDAWGMAGPGAYWKPVLVVDVSPDSEARYAELVELLRGSGIALERRSP